MGKTLYLGDTWVQHVRQIPDVAPLRSFLHSNPWAKLPFARERKVCFSGCEKMV